MKKTRLHLFKTKTWPVPMLISLHLRSGKSYELRPQLRLTKSKTETTGTAILEINVEEIDFINNSYDPIYTVSLKKRNFLRKADVCNFVWQSGKPLKLVAIFIFSNSYERQDFFDNYSYYANNHSLEFFPAKREEKL